MRPTTHSLREDLAEAMLAMRELCESDGLPWTAEVVTLIGAWGETRRAMGRHGTLKIDLPEPDAGERSPAHQLLTRARNTPTGRLADGGGQPIAAQPPPLPPPAPTIDGPGRMLGPMPTFYRTRLSGAMLYTMLATGKTNGNSVLICEPSITLESARSRCSSINALCASHRLRCKLNHEGLVTIRRIPR